MISASLSQISPQRRATLPSHQTVPSTTPYYKVLKSAIPQYYSVLQSTTPEGTTPVLQSTNPVLLRTTKYYFVLQSTSPVLLRTTKYYSSTTPYYKVLAPVLLRTIPVLLHTTKYYSSTTNDYSSTTKY